MLRDTTLGHDAMICLRVIVPLRYSAWDTRKEHPCEVKNLTPILECFSLYIHKPFQ